MDPIVIEQIIKFIETYFKQNKNAKKLYITWFGREPLLGYDTVIKPLSQKIKKLSKRINFDYHSSIITNGFYLNLETGKELIEYCNVDSFQITFDGTCSEYCKRKTTNPRAYYTTKENLLSLCDYIHTNDIKANITVKILVLVILSAAMLCICIATILKQKILKQLFFSILKEEPFAVIQPM